mmetsp:Transcript_36785/g.45941  ORF Transcript_36785/g.45941 Transcript_36785/m.45941 type:complete len:313 (+) Transcript_36785:116-1054(+)
MENLLHLLPELEGKNILFEGKQYKIFCFTNVKKAKIELVKNDLEESSQASKRKLPILRKIDTLAAIKGYFEFSQAKEKTKKGISYPVKKVVFDLAKRTLDTQENIKRVKRVLLRTKETKEEVREKLERHYEQMKARGTELYPETFTEETLQRKYENSLKRAITKKEELELLLERSYFNFSNNEEIVDFFQKFFSIKLGESTIREWLRRGRPPQKGAGRNPVLSKEAEKNICKIANRLDATGTQMTRKVIQNLAADCLPADQREKLVGTRFGRHWFNRWFERMLNIYPNLRYVKARGAGRLTLSSLNTDNLNW